MSTGYRKVGFRALWLRRLGFRGEYVLEKHTCKGLFAFRCERGRKGQERCERAFRILSRERTRGSGALRESILPYRRERGREGLESCERAYCIPVRLRRSERVEVWFWSFLRVERSRGSECRNWCKSERKFIVWERPEDLVVIADRVSKLRVRERPGEAEVRSEGFLLFC